MKPVFAKKAARPDPELLTLKGVTPESGVTYHSVK